MGLSARIRAGTHRSIEFRTGLVARTHGRKPHQRGRACALLGIKHSGTRTMRVPDDEYPDAPA
eukprot:14363973-Alexandrium_andersonii.AAC.1